MRTDFTISPTYLAGVIDSATDEELEAGRTWYEREGKWVENVAKIYEATPAQVASIVAVLSSQAPWDATAMSHPVARTHNNKLTTLSILDILCDYPDRLESASLFATQRQRQQCQAIYENPDYQPERSLGPKRFPFAWNLLGDLTQLTIDSMAWGAVIGWQGTLAGMPECTPRRRNLAEAAYCWLAEQLGVELAQAQAMVWIPYRRLRKEHR